MTVHIYARQAPGAGPLFSDGNPSPAAKALLAYAEAQGYDPLVWHVESTLTRPSRIADRVTGGEMLRALHDGDTLLTHSLSDLCDLPSDLDRLMRGLAGRGIDCVVVTIAQADRVRVLRAAIEAFTPLEAELERVREELTKVQANADARLVLYRQTMAQQLVENWGLPPSLSLGLPTTVGDVTKPPTNGGIGPVIKAKREAKGLTQQAFGEALGMRGKAAQSNISKLERGESTYMWQEALAYLGGEHASA